MKDFVCGHQIKLGRDKFHKLLKDNNLLSNRKGKRVRTTNSEHCNYKYPNRAKSLISKRANALWVADMTNIPLGSNFAYLSVILDAYSRKIVGWHLDKTMLAQGLVQALDMALLFRPNPSQPLIHHSDRCVQYCSWKYVNRLRNENVSISIAESVFRTLKEDFRLRAFLSFSAASISIERAIHAYNNLGPHVSIGYLTPNQVHRRSARSH